MRLNNSSALFKFSDMMQEGNDGVFDVEVVKMYSGTKFSEGVRIPIRVRLPKSYEK